jgi:hypothetical protein
MVENILCKMNINLIQGHQSDSDDLKSSEIKIEVRMRGLHIISNCVVVVVYQAVA